MIKKGDILTLSDNNEYTVVDILNANNNTYVYLVDINNVVNFIYGKVENDEITEIEDSNELEFVVNAINDNMHKA